MATTGQISPQWRDGAAPAHLNFVERDAVVTLRHAVRVLRAAEREAERPDIRPAHRGFVQQRLTRARVRFDEALPALISALEGDLT